MTFYARFDGETSRELDRRRKRKVESIAKTQISRALPLVALKSKWTRFRTLFLESIKSLFVETTSTYNA